MRSVLVAILMACTAVTGVAQPAFGFSPAVVLDTTGITDSRPLGYGEKVCTGLDGADCWIEYHRN